jgi:cell division protein FtsI (penicillin-binding protein 3)
MARRGSRPALRLIGLLGVFTLLSVAVVARLVQLQVVQAAPLETLGEQQRVRELAMPARRGSILDRDLDPLAVSTEARAIYANPRLLALDGIDTDLMARQIAPLLDRDRSTILAALQEDAGFVYLARRVSPQVADQVLSLHLPTIDTLPESTRYYPADATAGQVLGFVNVDDLGLSGVEASQHAVLSGTPGLQIIERDPQGRPIPQGRSSITEPVPGSDVVLTIDRDLQFITEEVLARGVASNRATRGTAIVMDPRTGEVLAMANHPPLNPNSFAGASADRRRNRAVTDVYEPGSIFKVMTAAAALESGRVTPDTRLTVPDSMPLGGYTFRDYNVHPTWRINFAQVLARSSNVGTIKVAQRVGPRALHRTMRAFGIGKRSGVGFPGEGSGLLLPPDEWYGTSIATIPIGQGVAATPLQMASVYATIANDGVRVRPRLIRGTVEPDGAFIEADAPQARRVVSAFTAAQVRAMLVGAVEDGTGSNAQIPGYIVGGKTGTANIPREDARGYSSRVIVSFAGLAPAEDPRLVVLVQLDNPRAGSVASITVAPVFRELMRFGLAHFGVPPSFGRAGAP